MLLSKRYSLSWCKKDSSFNVVKEYNEMEKDMIELAQGMDEIIPIMTGTYLQCYISSLKVLKKYNEMIWIDC